MQTEEGVQERRYRTAALGAWVPSQLAGFLATAILVALVALGAAPGSPVLAVIAGATALAAPVALTWLAGRVGIARVGVIAEWWGGLAALAGFALVLHAQRGYAPFAYAALLFAFWLPIAAGVRHTTASDASHAVRWAREHAVLLVTAAVLLLAWTPSWLGYFPAIMSPDSLSEWQQALFFRLNDASPAIYTLYLWLTGTSFGTPATASALQVVLSALTLGALTSFLQRKGAPLWTLGLGVALYLALPIFGTFTVTLWHDIPYSLLVLWITHAVYQIYRTDGAWLRRRGRTWALGAALALLPLFAHNGISVVFGVLAGGLVLIRGQRRRLGWLTAGVIAGFLLFQYLLYPALGVQPYSKAFASEAMVHQISAAITEHGTQGISASDLRYLQEIMPLDDWGKKYNPYTPQFLVSPRFNPAYDPVPINRHFSRFVAVWERVGMAHPWSYLKERVTENALVLQPTGFDRIALSPLRVFHNTLGLSTQSLAQPLVQTLRAVVDWSVNNVIWLWRPFWVMWLLAALTAVAAFMRRRAVVFAAIPWIFQVLGLAISIQGQSVRYYYSLFLILPYFIAIFFTRESAGEDLQVAGRPRPPAHSVARAAEADA